MTVKPIADTPAPVAPDAFAQAHRRLLADSSIQFDLPSYEPPQAPGWLRSLWHALESAGPLFRVLFWVAVAALVVYLIYLLALRIMGRDFPFSRRRDEGADGDLRPEAGAARQLLAEADGLAARGLFGEAVRLLLFRSIEDIDARRPNLLCPALTSRDIASLPAIPARPRDAFARIAAGVERSLFARRPLGEEDWRACRSAFEEFAFAKGWRG